MLIVLAVWMKSLTGSSALAGLTFFVFAAGSLLAPLGGLLADRVRRRPLMIVADCVLGAFVLVLLLVHDRSDAWLIYAVAFAYGAVGTVFFPARAALLKIMLPEELLADANGALTATREGLRIIAPLAGAGLYTVLGGSAVAVLDSATFAASAFFLSRMRVVEEKPAPPEHHFVREVTAGLRHVWETLPLRQIVGGVAVALLVVGFAETLIFYVIAALGKTPSFFGVFATIQGVGSIAGGVTAAAVLRRFGEVRLVGLGLALFAFADLCLIVPSLGDRARRRPDRRHRRRLGDRRLLDGAPDAHAARDPGSCLRCRRPHALGRAGDVDRDRCAALHLRRLPDPLRSHGGRGPGQRRLSPHATGADPGACDDGGVTELVPLRRNRDFILYQSGGLLSTFGSGISGIAYPLLTLALTHSAAKTGYVGAVEFLPLVILSAPAGVAADRFDRRRLMIAADAAGATALALLGTAVLTGHATFWMVVVVAFVDTSAAVLYRSGSSGAVKAVVPTPQLADASSVTMARMSTVRLVAPPVGGVLFDLSRGLPFLVDAVSYVFSTAALLLMRTPFQEERVPGARTPFREGLAYFWGIPFLRTTTGMIAASNLVAAGAPIALIILAHRQGISAFAIGVFVAIQGVALLLGSTLSPLLRRRFPMRAILLSEFWMALIYVAFLVYPSVYVLAVCVSLHAFWFPNTDSAIQAYSYMLIPDRLLGRAMAAATTLRAASAPLGPLVAGLLLAHTSPQVAIAVLAAPVVIAAIVGTLSDSIRNLPSLEASPAAAG